MSRSGGTCKTAAKRNRSRLPGTVSPASHRPTVRSEHPTWRANSTWVSPRRWRQYRIGVPSRRPNLVTSVRFTMTGGGASCQYLRLLRLDRRADLGGSACRLPLWVSRWAAGSAPDRLGRRVRPRYVAIRALWAPQWRAAIAERPPKDKAGDRSPASFGVTVALASQHPRFRCLWGFGRRRRGEFRIRSGQIVDRHHRP